MARMMITRAYNVRRYEDFEIDTDELSPEMLTRLGAEGFELDAAEFGVEELDEVLESHVVLSEDYDQIMEPMVNYMVIDPEG